jgi:hypothetical protein
MIDVVELGPNDIFCVKVDVGQMPPLRAKEYLEEIKSKLRENLGSQPIMLLPCKDAETQISIIKRT